MLAEVLDLLGPRDGGVYVDGTFGAGGYTRAILEHAECRVLAIDRDPDALALGAPLVEEFGGRFTPLEGRFSQMAELARNMEIQQVDGVVLDLGVSSMQLDRPERGFSFANDGPLNMRMDQGLGEDAPNAADIVNTYEEDRLAAILWRLGEEKRSRRIARAIVDARAVQPIETTGALVAIIEQAVGGSAGHSRIHPATRAFQALRIYVNRELDELARGLAAAEELLCEGGRLVVVSFHSLEDRIVKTFFRTRAGTKSRPSRHLPEIADPGPEPSFRMLVRGTLGAGEAEVSRNPRARSAKLRAAERTSAAVIPLDIATSNVPILGSA